MACHWARTKLQGERHQRGLGFAPDSRTGKRVPKILQVVEVLSGLCMRAAGLLEQVADRLFDELELERFFQPAVRLGSRGSGP